MIPGIDDILARNESKSNEVRIMSTFSTVQEVMDWLKDRAEYNEHDDARINAANMLNTIKRADEDHKEILDIMISVQEQFSRFGGSFPDGFDSRVFRWVDEVIAGRTASRGPDYSKFASMIRSLRENSVMINNVDIASDGHIVSFEIDGFGKSGKAYIEYEPVSDLIKVHTRYDRTTIIDGYDDLVYEAWYWYTVSKDKGYVLPEQFIPDFVRLKLVKKVVVPERVEYKEI